MRSILEAALRLMMYVKFFLKNHSTYKHLLNYVHVLIFLILFYIIFVHKGNMACIRLYSII